ncbi:hypothetical protein ACRQDV_07435 [Actinotignum sp. GS-2025e]|uniref:hypothetical protein n=1 Tax=Actinotignum sp. GS-2025e TaxID=3427278 RepID=UPI003F46906F
MRTARRKDGEEYLTVQEFKERGLADTDMICGGRDLRGNLCSSGVIAINTEDADIGGWGNTPHWRGKRHIDYCNKSSKSPTYKKPEDENEERVVKRYKNAQDINIAIDLRREADTDGGATGKDGSDDITAVDSQGKKRGRQTARDGKGRKRQVGCLKNLLTLAVEGILDQHQDVQVNVLLDEGLIKGTVAECVHNCATQAPEPGKLGIYYGVVTNVREADYGKAFLNFRNGFTIFLSAEIYTSIEAVKSYKNRAVAVIGTPREKKGGSGTLIRVDDIEYLRASKKRFGRSRRL